MKIKILTWNIHKGFDIGNRRLTIAEAREAIRSTGADVVFLQEVQGEHLALSKRHADWPASAQFEYLADSVWPHHAYGKNAVYDEGHHGNAILSRFPIEHWHNLDLTLHKKEMRGMLHAEVVVPNTSKRLHLMNTHINLLHTHRVKQVELICKYIQDKIPKTAHLLLAGDFNDWTKQLSEPLCATLEMAEVFTHLHGEHAKTFPCFFPVMSLDRMYFRNALALEGKVLNTRPWVSISDHLPLYAEIEL